MSVMNVKQSVKAFGDNSKLPQATASEGAPQFTSEQMKQMGGENVGEVLNKMSDPNWVDPGKKMRTVGNDKMDKDAFFKLMLAQMKNQDPTNPLKSHEMAAQLASFSSLEQMQNINTTLNEMKSGQKPMEQFHALNFIGKSVAGDSAKLVRAKGDREHDFRYNLPVSSNDVKITVKNLDGEVVKTFNLKGLKAGEQRLTWTGEDDKGNKAAAGEYQFSVEAVSPTGQKLAVKTEFDGVITGVNYTPEGPVLMVGNQTIRLRDVKKIIDPSLTKNDQKIAPDLKSQANAINNGNVTESKTPVQTTTDEGAPEAKKKPMDGLIGNVGLSRDMMTKLAKEVGT